MIDWRPGRITCPYIKRYLNAPERLRKRPYPLMHPGGIVGGALSDHYFRRDGLWFVGIGPRAECTAWGGRLIGCGYCAMAPPRDGATQNPEEQ